MPHGDMSIEHQRVDKIFLWEQPVSLRVTTHVTYVLRLISSSGLFQHEAPTFDVPQRLYLLSQ
jgi:hypothetical protein